MRKQSVRTYHPPSGNSANAFESILTERAVFEDEQDFLSWTKENLPLVEWNYSPSFPSDLSILLISPASLTHHLEGFLIDLIRIRLQFENLRLRFAKFTPFNLEKYQRQNFLGAEFQFSMTTNHEIEKIQQHLDLLSKEITLYLSFPQYAETLLKLGTSKQEIYFQEFLLKLLHRWPDEFEKDLLQDYQHFLGFCEKEFRIYRSIRHQARILCSLYLLRKKLRQRLSLSQSELSIEIRLLPTRLDFPFSQKAVLGIAIAINLPSSYERFNDHHIMVAAQKFIPWSQAIKESFLSFEKPGTSIKSLYLEIEKTNDSSFSLPEIALLKQNLKEEFKKSVEILKPSIFGLCDVEEVMRNTFLLSQELQTPSDLPQVMISFEGSAAKSLIFRIIVVRLLNEQSQPLPAYFQPLTEPFEYIPERSSTIAYRGRYEKEATIFRLQISKTPFLLRSNSSLNLYRARHYIYSILTKALGEIRDYNGGLFSKQLELFNQFRQSFEQEDLELLEDFFHSINPPELQAILPLPCLITLFELFQKAQKFKQRHESSYFLEIKESPLYLFVFIHLKSTNFHEKITQALIQANLFKNITAWTVMKRCNGLMLGYIAHSCAVKNKLLLDILRGALENWASKKANSQTLRLSMQHLPVSLDPRLGGDQMSGVILKMLFEGLIRKGKEGPLECAVAADVIISPDQKTYTFSLRRCFWNNGDLITAQDFCYAWKKILSSSFASSFSYLFYAIKNAKKAKEGKVSLDEVGISVLDDQTLKVELEHPYCYFLELLDHPIYSPVNHRIDRIHPNWSLQAGKAYICNGPFQLEKVDSQEGYILTKNPFYRDASSVQLKQIQISRANAKKALELFEKGEIDWLGRPFRPFEPFFNQGFAKSTETLSSSVVCWCACNVQTFPFQSIKLRQALSYALDRRAIIEQLSLDKTPALSPLPKTHTQYISGNERSDPEKAQALFKEVLEELGGVTKWPILTFIHGTNEIRKEIAHLIVQQWKEVLGITVRTEGYDFRDLFHKMTKGNYQLGMMMWRSYVDDPLATLNSFKHASEDLNFSKWANTDYQKLLDQADQEQNFIQRLHILSQAESLLIQEMPVIPICHEMEIFSRAQSVDGIFFSRSWNIDFKYAFKRIL